MNRRWPSRLCAAILLGGAGCVPLPTRTVATGGLRHSHEPPLFTLPGVGPAGAAIDPEPAPPELVGPQPVDAYIRRALSENRTVQAARFNVMALKHRIPQVTALDDPVVSNTIYPIPSVAPQYSLMGYNPYNLLIAQQFPWFGTLRLRGEAAEQDVKVALAELCAAQLDAVAAVKRAYYDLYFNERAERILLDNRGLVKDFLELAEVRYSTGKTSQQDVLRAEVIVADLDRELVTARQNLAEARADLSQQLHVSPESELRTIPEVPLGGVPTEIDRLYRLAAAARPELAGRLAAVARDERAVELARKRYYPNLTVGLSYMDMEKTNAVTPRTAGGMPNVGLFVGFNLPVNQKKLAAGVCEAQARASADAKLFEAERDAAFREVKDLMTQARARRDILGLFRDTILPRSEQALTVAATDYEAGNIDYLTLITAWREVLQVRLQVAQVESELGKALASLERAVGVQLNEHPIAPAAAPAGPPPSPAGPGPFEPKPSHGSIPDSRDSRFRD